MCEWKRKHNGRIEFQTYLQTTGRTLPLSQPFRTPPYKAPHRLPINLPTTPILPIPKLPPFCIFPFLSFSPFLLMQNPHQTPSPPFPHPPINPPLHSRSTRLAPHIHRRHHLLHPQRHQKERQLPERAVLAIRNPKAHGLPPAPALGDHVLCKEARAEPVTVEEVRGWQRRGRERSGDGDGGGGSCVDVGR